MLLPKLFSDTQKSKVLKSVHITVFLVETEASFWSFVLWLFLVPRNNHCSSNLMFLDNFFNL